MFQKSIEKNYLFLKDWLKKENLEAFRIYDLELKDFPLTIDIYKNYAHTSIYESPNHSIKDLVTLVKNTMKDVLQIEEEKNIFKLRKRQKNGTQYEKLGNKQQIIYIQEYSIQYKINLTDYLDTGLFLDHRESRKILPSFLKNAKRVLNLFSYTGAFSLVAAKAGVEFTTSVDMSNTYCSWAKENFELNQLEKYKHIVIRDNVLFFLENIQKKNWKFDFIILDPPTVSRSKKMLRKFDIQRDHEYLIDMCTRYLNPNGKIFFSTNFQKFKLSPQVGKKFKISDLTENSYSLDFKNKKIHKVYLLEL